MTAWYLHACAVCGAPFYGGQWAYRCAAHLRVSTMGNRECLGCGARLTRRRSRLCATCARERRRKKDQRIDHRRLGHNRGELNRALAELEVVPVTLQDQKLRLNLRGRAKDSGDVP